VSVSQANRKQVLDFLRGEGDVTIADIADKVRLSKSTIKKVIDLSLTQGMVREAAGDIPIQSRPGSGPRR